MRELIDNPTRAHVAAAVAAGRRDVPLDTNPASASFGAVLREGRPGELRLGFVAPPESTQGNGVVSGGAMASMLDLAMAMSVLSVLPPGRNCATINLSVNMMAAAQAGPLVATASVERVGRTVGFARASLYDASGERLLASATSALAVFYERPGAPLDA
jgi:uncharacterized protein (TIGR00369 family)